MPKKTEAAPPPLKMPKTLGACADLYGRLRDDRLAAEKVAAEIAKREAEAREHLIKMIPAADTTGVSGKVYRVTRHVKKVPQVKDWALFYAHVKRTGHFELLQKRLGEAAIGERWDAGKSVPGVEAFTAVTLSVGKV
jgi:hypothetical protein